MSNASFALETPSSQKPWLVNTATASSSHKLLYLVQQHHKALLRGKCLPWLPSHQGSFINACQENGELRLRDEGQKLHDRGENLILITAHSKSYLKAASTPWLLCLPNPCKALSRPILEFKSLHRRALLRKDTCWEDRRQKLHILRDFWCFSLLHRQAWHITESNTE